MTANLLGTIHKLKFMPFIRIMALKMDRHSSKFGELISLILMKTQDVTSALSPYLCIIIVQTILLAMLHSQTLLDLQFLSQSQKTCNKVPASKSCITTTIDQQFLSCCLITVLRAAEMKSCYKVQDLTPSLNSLLISESLVHLLLLKQIG